jgi:hypothetical protein
MNMPDVARLMAFMAAFDQRTTGEADDEAWASLPIIQRIDLQTAKDAVVLFHDQEPDQYGNSRWLNPQQFKRCVRLVLQRRETERARIAARTGITRGAADPKPEDFDEIKAAANRARLAEMMRGGGQAAS